MALYHEPATHSPPSHLGEGVTEAVSFGGICKWPENHKSDADLDPNDETTVMRFGKLVPV